MIYSSPFKVIIVGGGPVGLTAAHALYHAGIQFVLLEKGEGFTGGEGAGLALAPSSLRILHQFGLLDKIMAIGAEVRRGIAMTGSGYEFRDTDAPTVIRERFGFGVLFVHRPSFNRILYEGLPDEAKNHCLDGKDVVGIRSDNEGVMVTCADGTRYLGSIVLGADGTHSRTRSLMRRLALGENAYLDWDPENPFVARYRAAFMSFPRPASSVPGEVYETQGSGYAMLYATGVDKVWAMATERLSRPRNRSCAYNGTDTEVVRARFAECPLDRTLKLKDLYDTRLNAGLTDLEEGVLKHWSWGRIVLAGDACHKFAPQAGLGLNNGLQDVVALCNGLYEAIDRTRPAELSYLSVRKVFRQYQDIRMPLIQVDARQALVTVRTQTWSNLFYRWMAQVLLRTGLAQRLLYKYFVCYYIKQGLVLNYIRGVELFRGEIEWMYPMKP